MGGLVIAAPLVTYQVWRFIAPALHRNEKRLVVPFLVLAIGGSIAGALFSHYVLFPGMMAFFGAFDSPRMRFMPRVEDTFALYKSTLIGMVVVFQIPTLVFVLARLGLVSARFLWRHLRYAVLAAVARLGAADAVNRPVEPARVRRADDRDVRAGDRHRLAGASEDERRRR